MVDRSASSVCFGFDFQSNAAIVLMIENIEDMATIRMEGFEDIEIGLNDGCFLLAQAKSVVNGSTDFSNVLRNLKDAIVSLSDANKNCPSVKQFIYITNSANPLTVASEKHIFYGLPAYRNYDSLPPKSKRKVDDIFLKLECSFDKSKLHIQTLPFETDDDRERYKYVINSIRDFISKIGNISINPYDLHKIWKDDIFKSGTRKDKNIKLTKNDIIWPIIVLTTENVSYDEDIDESEMEEISRSYKDVINICAEKYEFVTKVLCSYNGYKEGEKNERIRLFIENKYQEYLYLLNDVPMNNEVKKSLTKAILYKILVKRIQIEKIKEATNL